MKLCRARMSVDAASAISRSRRAVAGHGNIALRPAVRRHGGGAVSARSGGAAISSSPRSGGRVACTAGPRGGAQSAGTGGLSARPRRVTANAWMPCTVHRGAAPGPIVRGVHVPTVSQSDDFTGHLRRPAGSPPGSSASTMATLTRLPTGSRRTSKLRHTAITISRPCCPTRPGSAGQAAGSAGSVSHTLISTAPSLIARSSRHGPGAYLYAFVTSSLTTQLDRAHRTVRYRDPVNGLHLGHEPAGHIPGLGDWLAAVQGHRA